jgi:hypothetical protein
VQDSATKHKNSVKALNSSLRMRKYNKYLLSHWSNNPEVKKTAFKNCRSNKKPPTDHSICYDLQLTTADEKLCN